MSGLLRYTSYSSSHSASHHIRPSPSSAALHPPTDPFPPQLNSLKPSDILINRSHQLKRFAKHLSLYFQGKSLILSLSSLGNSPLRACTNRTRTSSSSTFTNPTKVTRKHPFTDSRIDHFFTSFDQSRSTTTRWRRTCNPIGRYW